MLTLTGAGHATEGAPYALTLGPVVDADPNHLITQYAIHWGDGATSTYTPGTLPSDRTVYHTYADGTDTTAQITVDLYEQSGAFFDPAFGGGPFRTNLGGTESGYDVAQDPTTGNVVVLGAALGANSFLRYRPDGTLDASFGSNGVVSFDNAVGLASHGLAIDTAGHILVGGQLGGDWAVARYNADGSRDATFGSNGIVTFHPPNSATLYALALDAQDRIYLTGEIFNPATNSWDLELVRLTATGQLDATFASGPTHIGSPNRATAISVDPTTGNVLVLNTSNLGIHLVRFTSAGVLDTTFGAGGIASVTTPPYGMPDFDMVVGADGSIFVGGYVPANGRNAFAVARYDANGVRDTTFGTNGTFSVNLGGFTEVVRGLARDAQGRVLLVGYSTPGTNGTDIELARLLVNADGPYLSLATKTITVDNVAPTVTLTGAAGSVLQGTGVSFQGSFTDSGAIGDGPYSYAWSVSASNGQTVAPLSGTVAVPGAVPVFAFTPTAGGAYTVSLTITDKDGGSTTQQVVVAAVGMTLTGAAATDEGSAYALTLGPVADGDPLHVVSQYVVHWGDGTTSTYAAATLPADRTVVHTYADGNLGTAVTRITVDLVETALVPDAAFGTGGTTIQNFNGLDSAYSVAEDPATGKLVVLGSVNGSLSLVRFRANGTLDPSFGTGGVVPYISVMGTYGYALAIDSAGRILVGGMTSTVATGSDFAVARYLASGALDTTFGTNGIASLPLGSNVESVFDLALDAQGRILLVGQAQAAANVQAMVVVRLTAAGQLDPTFTTTVQTVNGFNLARAVAVDPTNGNILVLASAGTQYALFRFLPDGTRDTAFGPNGRRTLTGVTAVGLAIDAAGRIYVGSQVGSNFALARYLPAGTPDTAVSSTGGMSFDLGSGSEDVNNITLDAQGRIILAGYRVGANPDFALLRLIPVDAGPYLAVADTTVAVNNVAPTATITAGPTLAAEGANVTFQGSFIDPALAIDGAYSYAWTVAASNSQSVPTLTSTVAVPGAVPAVSFTAADNGTYVVKLTVTDKDGAHTTATRTLTVTNVPPTASIAGPTTALEGDQVTFAGTFADPAQAVDGTYLVRWSVSHGGVTDVTTATVTQPGAVPNLRFTAADDGVYLVTLTVIDKDGGSTDANAQLVAVNVPPTAAIAGPAVGLEGAVVAFRGSHADPAGAADAPYTYTWSVIANNGQVVPGLVGDSTSAADFAFTPADNGTYTVTLVVTDKDGDASPPVKHVLTVGNVAPTATITAGPASSLEGDAVTFQGAFTDPGATADGVYNYAWTVTASNGEVIPAQVGSAGSPGAVGDFTFTPADNGTYTVTLVVTDKDGDDSVAVQRTLTVANVPPTAGITGPTRSLEGDAVTFAGSFSDAGGAADAPYGYSWSVVASNGQVVAGLTGTGAIADFTFTPADNGRYTISLVVTDKDGSPSDAAQQVLTVANVSPTAAISGPLLSLEGAVVTFAGAFTDPGAADAPYDYAWTVMGSNGQVVAPASGVASTTGAVPGFTFTPADDGTYTVTLVVTDKDGAASTAAQQTLTVANVIPTATIAGGPTVADEGTAVTFVGAFADPGLAADADYVYTWTVTADNGQVIPAVSGLLAAPGAVPAFDFVPVDNGTYTITLVVTDKDGAASVTAQQMLTVANVMPTATITAGPTRSLEGDAVTFEGSFTDPGAARDGDFAYTWSVTASNGQVVDPGNGIVAMPGAVPDFTFTPVDNGTYTIRLSVSDKDEDGGTIGLWTLTVANVPPTATITAGPSASDEGAPVRFAGSFTDPGLAADAIFAYTWSVMASNGQVIAPLHGTASAPGAVPAFDFTPADDGTFTVSLVVTDKDGARSAAAVTQLVVQNVPPTASIIRGPTASKEGDAVAFAGAFTDPGVQDGPYAYAWSVIASNGQAIAPQAGSVAAAGGVPDFHFTPADDGSYTVSLFVTDKDGARSAVAQQTLIVSNVPPTATISSGPAVGKEGDAVEFSGSFVDQGQVLDGAFFYRWEVRASNGQAVAPVLGIMAAPGAVPGFQFTPDDNGTYTVGLVVADKDGGVSNAAERVLTVANVPPTARILRGPALGLPGSGVTLAGVFSDPGQARDAVFTYTWTVTANNGQAAGAFVSGQAGPGLLPRFTFLPTGVGQYTIRLVVTDKDGGASSAAVTTVTVPGVPALADLGTPVARNDGVANVPRVAGSAAVLPAARGLPAPPLSGVAGTEGPSLIAGAVYQEAAPAAGVTVLLERATAGGFVVAGSAVTGADGSFTFTGMPPATYRVRCADRPGLGIRNLQAQRVHCLPPAAPPAAGRTALPIDELATLDVVFRELANLPAIEDAWTIGDVELLPAPVGSAADRTGALLFAAAGAGLALGGTRAVSRLRRPALL